MSDEPKITVGIPVFNGARDVGAAIESVLNQSFTDFELLLLDDGSTDHSLDILRGFRDPRIRIECNPINKGLGYSRNRLVELARGPYFANLDQDDVAMPQRLGRQLAYLEAHKNCAAVGSWYRLMKEDGRSLRTVKRRPCGAREIEAWLLFRSVMHQPAVMARTEILRRHPQRPFPVAGDYELWGRLAKHYELANLPEALVCYRQSSYQTTRSKADLLLSDTLEIQASLLRDLGIAASEDEVQAHFELPRSRRAGRRCRTDAGYRAWAAQWLDRLEAANQESGRYDAGVFGRVLAQVWLALCWRALKRGEISSLAGLPRARRWWPWAGRSSG